MEFRNSLNQRAPHLFLFACPSSRLSQLRKMFPGASKKMLTQHLREMQHDGIVVRSDLSGPRRHVEYSLEEPLGVAVLHLINTLTEWGSQYAPARSSQPLGQELSEEQACATSVPE
jgi:DNA-binding HxlR family transcriptional regulator